MNTCELCHQYHQKPLKRSGILSSEFLPIDDVFCVSTRLGGSFDRYDAQTGKKIPELRILGLSIEKCSTRLSILAAVAKEEAGSDATKNLRVINEEKTIDRTAKPPKTDYPYLKVLPSVVEDK